MRKQHHGLGCADEYPAAQLVEQDGQHQRGQGAGYDEQEVQNQRIADDGGGVGGFEEKLKILESAPFAAKNAQLIVEVLEGDDHIGVGQVAEHQHIQKRRQDQQIGKAVPANIGEEGIALLRQRGRRNGLRLHFPTSLFDEAILAPNQPNRNEKNP